LRTAWSLAYRLGIMLILGVQPEHILGGGSGWL
jgi:hypothetical protein